MFKSMLMIIFTMYAISLNSKFRAFYIYIMTKFKNYLKKNSKSLDLLHFIDLLNS